VSERDTHTKQSRQNGESSTESLSPDQILNKETRVLAYLPAAHGPETDVEITVRKTSATVEAQVVTFCEACVTTINTATGERTTRCLPVPCPQTGKAPTPTTNRA
jgi:hypothetical protein